MDTVTDGTKLRLALDVARAGGSSVGFVPTLGYLHAGHESLLRRAAAEHPVRVLSVFVNPTQFNDPSDFERYPRDLAGDASLAERCGMTWLFLPGQEDMYPTPPLTTVSVAEITEGMEGAHRPGHFEGVGTVVAKFFNIVGPCHAYFGEKDWQQVALVRQMIRDLSFPVQLVACPTIRDQRGRALSSRHARMSPAELEAAVVVYAALQDGQVAASDGGDVVATVVERVAAEPLARLEYAEVRDGRIHVAVHIGATRLIDNVAVAD